MKTCMYRFLCGLVIGFLSLTYLSYYKHNYTFINKTFTVAYGKKLQEYRDKEAKNIIEKYIKKWKKDIVKAAKEKKALETKMSGCNKTTYPDWRHSNQSRCTT